MALFKFVWDYRVSRHQKGKTNLDLLEHKIVSSNGISWTICRSVPWPRYNHASIPPLSFLQAGCPSCRLTNSVKSLIINWHLQLLYFLKNFLAITIVLTIGIHVYVPPFNQTTSCLIKLSTTQGIHSTSSFQHSPWLPSTMTSDIEHMIDNLPAHQGHLIDRNFIKQLLYKNMY